MITVTTPKGLAQVERSKIKLASSEAIRDDVLKALRTPQIEQFAAVVDGESIDGQRTLKRGTVEFDRVALSRIPNAFVTED